MNFDYTMQPGRELKNMPKYQKDEPVISIIMAFYNDKNYIRQAVNSVLNQTFPYFELLIIDDGSTDQESLKVLQEVSQIDDRIRVLHKQNEGPAVARDYGAKNASNSTKYLMILDSDDVIDHTFLECAFPMFSGSFL